MKTPARIMLLDPNFVMEDEQRRIDLAEEHSFSWDDWDKIVKGAANVGKPIAQFVVDSAVASAMLIEATLAMFPEKRKGGGS